jgi:hypothetical protein
MQLRAGALVAIPAGCLLRAHGFETRIAERAKDRER